MLTIVDRDAYPVAWREAGTGRLALFLHGLGGSRTSWDVQLEDLGDERRCIAWDMPGYGASRAPLTDLEQLADAAADLIVALGEEQADVVGLSLGGMVAQHLAIRHPRRVRTLALVDTSPAFGLDGTSAASWLSDRLTPLDEGATVGELAERVIPAVAGPRCPPEVLASATAAMCRVPSAGLRAACAALVRHDVRAWLPQISAPTAVLVGELDQETPVAYAQVLADGIQGATLHVVPDAGHLLNVESPVDVNLQLRHLWLRAERQAA